MSSFLAKLNLRPQERRLLVIVSSVVFAVLNVWFVWPHFKDWGRLQQEQGKAQKTLQNYKREVAKVPSYQARLNQLEAQGVNAIPQEQELDLLLVKTVQNLARLTGISLNQSTRRISNTVTNQFFEEQANDIRIEAGTDELVNFMISLASTNSLIRVQDLRLSVAPGGFKLNGYLTLVASYQKNPATKPAASAARANAVAKTSSPASQTKPVASPARTNKSKLATPGQSKKAAPK